MRAAALLLVLCQLVGQLCAGHAQDVVAVTDASWASTIESESSEWMVEFYAPWCGHCKAFAPVWEEVATKLKPSTGVKFAKVDATAETASAAKFGVKSYPKIFFLEKNYAQDNEHMREFKGGRNAEAVEKFLHKVIGPPVIELKDEEATSVFKANNEITYVLFSSGSDDEIETEYAGLGKKYLDTLYFGRCEDPSLFPDLSAPAGTVVAAINSESDSAQWYSSESKHTLEEFILATQFPPMVALSRKNFWQISNAGKMVLLAVIDPGNDSSAAYRKLVGGVAQQYQYDLYSGWLDGVEWEKYVNELFMVEPGQTQTGTAVVYDAPNKQFYRIDEPTTSEAAVQRLIDGVLSKSLEPINTERGVVKSAKNIVFNMAEQLEENPVLFIPLALPIVGLMYLVMGSGGEPRIEKED